MPAFFDVVGTPATPQFAEVLVRGSMPWSVGTRSIVQVYHLKQRPPFVYTPESDLGDTLMATISASLSAALSVTYSAVDVRTRYLDDPTFGDLGQTNTIVGAITGDRLPGFNAVTVQLRSSARGRNFKGSKHFAPIGESDTTLDKLTGAAQTRWNAVAAFIESMNPIAPGDGSEWDLIVLSTTLSDLVANPSVFTYAPVVQCIANPIIGTMKRRKEKSNT